jgi:hypothetical protein
LNIWKEKEMKEPKKIIKFLFLKAFLNVKICSQKDINCFQTSKRSRSKLAWIASNFFPCFSSSTLLS